MRVLCNARELQAAVKAVSKFKAAKRCTLPITHNVRLEASIDQLWLTCTDLEAMVTTAIPADTSEIGETTVSVKSLSDLIANQDKASTITIHANGAKLVEVCHAQLESITAEDFPPMPQAGKTHITLDAQEFKRAVQSVDYCAASDDNRPVLTGVLLDFADNALTLVTADGFRLSEYKIILSGPAPTFSFIVPAYQLSKIVSLVGKKTDCLTIVADIENGSRVAFVFDSIIAQVQLIQGTFPNYHQLIPQQHTTSINIAREPFLQHVKQAYAVASLNKGVGIVRLDIAGPFENNGKQVATLTITARSEYAGEAYCYFMPVNVDCLEECSPYVSDNIPDPLLEYSAKIAFNGKYLVNLFSSLDSQFVNLQITNPSSPGAFRPVGQPSYIQVIMPMFVQWDNGKGKPELLPAFNSWAVEPCEEMPEASEPEERPNTTCPECVYSPVNGGNCEDLPAGCEYVGDLCARFRKYLSPDKQMAAEQKPYPDLTGDEPY